MPRRVTQGTAGRILELLRRGPRTVDELTTALDLTPSAVRAQLRSLEHDGLVERRGSRRGTSKPAQVYGITVQAELLFSRAYVPILTQLLHVLVRRTPPAEFDALIREVGRLTEVDEENGFYIIRSHGCPLAAATADHPEVCNVLESMLSEFVGAPVTKCCDRYDRVHCCFEIARGPDTAAPARH